MTQRKSASSDSKKNEGRSSQNNRKRPLRRRRRRRNEGADNTSSSKRSNRSSRQSRENEDKSSGDRRRRTSQARRRRRVRRRSRNEPTAPSIMDDIEQEYTPPTSVFVYTHVVRPSSGGGYEFRSESFPKSSRRIEDYQIDYSHIMGAILEVDPENLPKFEWYWGPDEEEPQEVGSENSNSEN